jgi:translation initiation factor 1
MGRDRKKKKKSDAGWADPASGFGSAFAGLSLGVELPKGPSVAEPNSDETKSEAEAHPPTLPKRAVLRIERKGHGGKEVTLVTHLGLNESESSSWCKELRRELGCGGHVDGETLVFHGDQRERLATLLEARGVKRISQ